ncbi:MULTISPECIES: hypothetical protein [Clostridia]|uniref:hypothetical protein n=1 Tax=Clostridia TaxID=186801 RepID=UPI000EA30FFD|nr:MULTISPECIES: hypothetical protein [Clostridia]NBJ71334.1 hypothetical protein [Roseburia sp. 1XD42-34]RKI74409.1 hypothetical protein D7V87_18840 [Clostridium sp. 1xD42-85]
MVYTWHTSKIYALPIVDGILNCGNTKFSYNEKEAKIQFVLADEQSQKFLDTVATGKNHELRARFGDSDSTYLLFPRCSSRLSKIESEVEDYTTVELTLKREGDSDD